MGSDLAQVNYIIKSLVASQQEGIRQYHIYTMADSKKLDEATGAYDLMGLFYALEGVQPYEHTPTVAGIAYKTTSDLLYDWTYDPHRTALLKLPHTVDGAAFSNENADFIYVLWAVTTKDENELISTNYTFPPNLGIKRMEQMNWDFSKTGKIKRITGNNVQVSGSPAFFRPEQKLTGFGLEVLPFSTENMSGQVNLSLNKPGNVQLELLDNSGTIQQSLIRETSMEKGNKRLSFKVKEPGLYLIKLVVDEAEIVKKVVVTASDLGLR